jgi:hypothetical protein
VRLNTEQAWLRQGRVTEQGAGVAHLRRIVCLNSGMDVASRGRVSSAIEVGCLLSMLFVCCRRW